MALEKKARDVITYEGERYFIEDRDTGCDDCAFRRSECHVPVLECRADYREDGRAVKFIKI
jgi:hypothetical protein